MDVDVDEIRRDVDEEHDRGMSFEVECVGRARGGVGEHAIAHESPVDEEVLIAAAAEAKSARDETAGARAADLALEVDEMFAGLAADHLRHALARRARGGEVEHDASVVLEAERE